MVDEVQVTAGEGVQLAGSKHEVEGKVCCCGEVVIKGAEEG